jgi:hypothetical protein
MYKEAEPAMICRIDGRDHGMCEKCVELDGKIDHYRGIASRITDEAMIRGIKVLIERANAQKAALHPEQR